MDTQIKDIVKWINRDNKTDRRLYVHMLDGREGCIYLRSTYWHKAGTIEGNSTKAEWKEVQSLALDVEKKTWHSVSEKELHPFDSKTHQVSERHYCGSRGWQDTEPMNGNYDNGPCRNDFAAIGSEDLNANA
jgi:hypothetical protein